ncbi:hypothetical protein LP419_36235 [Massilia sp. H-1]|nr:hypothetical protein LP419_36235 [Massilia sp. H-1]
MGGRRGHRAHPGRDRRRLCAGLGGGALDGARQAARRQLLGQLHQRRAIAATGACAGRARQRGRHQPGLPGTRLHDLH